ncbi:hypothetical protein [Erythrobacter sp. SAORIC-644]|uniref:hypothetical protein n=1 Tax=Erythrobacter sp. SAORIC-644 TaxID=1869314 RepID=UPI0011AFC768|nr:hypothetical protein [Erythrobacter sp. SAORIC-644]
MKVRLEIALEHAVAFLADPYADHLAPLDIGEKQIASTDGCVAFQVNPYFEGGADITISSAAPSESKPNYEKVMTCESGVISISDSARFNYCMFPIDGKIVTIQIWNLSSEEGGIWVKLSPLIEY